MPNDLNAHASFCRPPRCRHLAPGLSLTQRGGLNLGFKGLDLLLRTFRDADASAHAIKAPTLVLWGAEDRTCHVSTVDRIQAKIPHSRASIIEGCGHIPLVEFPWLTRKLYLDFLNGGAFDRAGLAAPRSGAFAG